MVRRKHGLTNSPEYAVWVGMKQRCYYPGSESFIYYGARNIAVCERWRKSFFAFYHDMGPRPSAKHSIDRKNPNGSYCKSNCKWSTPIEQAANRRPRSGVQFRDRLGRFAKGVA